MTSDIANALERIIRWIEQHKPSYVTHLKPGLLIAEIEEIVRNLPFQLPLEFCQLYQCKNGAREGDWGRETAWIFENWTFLPLQEAVARHQKSRSEARLLIEKQKHRWRNGRIKSIPYFRDFKRLKIFYNAGQYQTGSIWIHKNLEFCPVIFESFKEGDLSILQKYTSLTSMMLTMAECYETGAYYIEPELYGGYFITSNLEKSRQIWHKYNSNIIEFALKALQPDALSGQFFRYFSDDLIEFKDLRAVEPLVQGLQILNHENADPFDQLEDPFNYFDPKMEIARILGELGDTRAVPALIAVLKDDYCNNWNYMTRVCAAKALGQLKDEQATYPLIDVLENNESEVRRMAAWALGEIKDTRAIEPLLRLMGDEDTIVLEAAQKALSKLA